MARFCLLLRPFIRYQFNDLVTLCARQLLAKLTSESLVATLKLGHLHRAAVLKDACFTFIKRNAATVLVMPEVIDIATEDPDLWNELTTAVSGRAPKKRK